jgi:hypothetical protein
MFGGCQEIMGEQVIRIFIKKREKRLNENFGTLLLRGKPTGIG